MYICTFIDYTYIYFTVCAYIYYIYVYIIYGWMNQRCNRQFLVDSVLSGVRFADLIIMYSLVNVRMNISCWVLPQHKAKRVL